MKRAIFLALVLMISIASHSQEKNIETESVALDNLITFVVENYSIDSDSDKTRNMTFLIETYADKFTTEDSVILKQAFKLLSKRVTEDDLISMVMYSNFNGIALGQTAATDLTKLLYTIEHPKSSVKTFQEDGIELAYEFTKENFIEEAENSVVMIRIPNRTAEVVATESVNTKETKKKKSNAIVLTAIAILPEIIAIIKD
ncbi:hypothetical protein DFQ11_102141 [Winogradskyella epiphytica]|uniref:TPM domain-containing protein n=1 Tax=Winogradskyella epiphytica TaxID=262005 RepID=A0A2V4YDL4_9FLAO|nr:hypothetical protein [Winogradskyella epiphytica]PYE81567.1 hypothetical protein DFQ11_102141 [Winogradskyella epiphytica]